MVSQESRRAGGEAGVSSRDMERETLDRFEFEALLAGTSEAKVLRERDEKRGQPGGSEPAPQRPPRRPQVGVPALVSRRRQPRDAQ